MSSNLVPPVPPFVPAVSSSARFSVKVPRAHGTRANPETPETGATQFLNTSGISCAGISGKVFFFFLTHSLLFCVILQHFIHF